LISDEDIACTIREPPRHSSSAREHLELVDERRERLAAMTDLILTSHGQLGGRHPELGQQEIGIVAESTGAARIEDYFALPVPFGDQRLRIERVTNQHDHTIVVRGPHYPRAQQFDELFVIARVRTGITREARGVHAGCAIKRVRQYAGIIGDRRHARVLGGVTRLGKRVFDECRMRLFSLGHTEIILRDWGNAKRREQCGEFSKLAGIARSDDDLFKRELHEMMTRDFGVRSGRKRALLCRYQIGDAAGREREHRIKLGAAKRRALGRTLHLDHASTAHHDDVHIGVAV